MFVAANHQNPKKREKNEIDKVEELNHLEANTDSAKLEKSGSTKYTVHDPISVEGDENFTELAEEEGWSGDGTEENPYIIQGYKIDNSDSDSEESAILIKQVDLHFKIQGNLITGGKDGTEVKYGINIYSSNNVTIEDNFVKGLQHEYSRGISIHFISDMIIQNNTITSFSSSTSGIDLRHCKDITIRNNELNNGGDIGIHIRYSKNITTIENIISESRTAGIKLDRTKNCPIMSNTILRSEYSGLLLFVSSYNHIVNNTFYQNEKYGFEVGVEPTTTTTRGNLLYNNNFIENSNQVLNLGDNQFYNESLGIGNYYSNYEEEYPEAERENGYWDTPYWNHVDDGFIDEYPMVEPSVPYIEIEKPINHMRTKERNVTVEWSDTYRHADELEYEVRLDEGEWENVGLSTEYELRDLPMGEHDFEVRTSDPGAESVGGKVTFTIISHDITVNDFAVEPTEGYKPLETKVTAELENEGNNDGNISMYVDEEKRKQWGLEAGETITVEERIEFEESGTYLVGIGDQSTEVYVETPEPEFTVDEFKVEPREGEAPLEIKITAEVNNIGEAEGEISLYVEDEEIKSWTVEPDENISVDESYEIIEGGDYMIELDGESAEVEVEESAIPFGSPTLVLVSAVIAIAITVYHRRSEKE